MGCKLWFMALLLACSCTFSGMVFAAPNEVNDGEASVEIEYICTENQTDYVQFKTQDSESDVLIVGAQTTTHYLPITTESNQWIIVHFNHYETDMSTGAVHVYVGSNPEASIYIDELSDCKGNIADTINPYGYYGVECAGASLVREDLADGFFYVDGQEYSINSDGTISWVVPIDMFWTWELFDQNGNLIARITQTDVNNCHIEEIEE